jgi:hypothetical protein
MRVAAAAVTIHATGFRGAAETAASFIYIRCCRDRLQLGPQVPDRLPSLLRVLFQAPAQQIVKPWIQLRRKGSEIGLANKNSAQDFRRSIALKELTSGQHLVQHAAEGEHIAAHVGIQTLHLLRRHVGTHNI